MLVQRTCAIMEPVRRLRLRAVLSDKMIFLMALQLERCASTGIALCFSTGADQTRPSIPSVRHHVLRHPGCSCRTLQVRTMRSLPEGLDDDDGTCHRLVERSCHLTLRAYSHQRRRSEVRPSSDGWKMFSPVERRKCCRRSWSRGRGREIGHHTLRVWNQSDRFRRAPGG